VRGGEASPQGYPAVVELAPTLLEHILQAMIHAAFPPGQTFADPRPGRGPYALLPGIRLTLTPPERPPRESASAVHPEPVDPKEKPGTTRRSALPPDPNAAQGIGPSRSPASEGPDRDATLVGVVSTLQDTATGQTGSYAIYFDVRPGAGELSLHVAFIDPAGSQPIDHLPPKLLHLALAGRGPIPWRLAPGVKAIMGTSLQDPGRALLYLASTPLDTALDRATARSSSHRSPRPAPPSTLLRRLPSGKKTQGGGPVQVLHREDWAALIDASVLRALLTETLSNLGMIQAEGARVQVERIAIPRMIAGGLEVELEARVDGHECSARGPLYIGYTLERASSDVPQLRTSVNASKLQVSGADALPGLLYALTAILPQLFLLVLPGIPATLESWVYGASGRGLARATDQGTTGPLGSLVAELLQPLPPELSTVIARPMLVRMDLSPRGLTLGIAYRPPPRSGVTKTPLEVPLRINTIGPASILLGWQRAGDRSLPPDSNHGDNDMSASASASARGGSRPTASPPPAPTLTVAGFAPLRPPKSLPTSATLYVSGHALDGVLSVHLVSGFHRRPLTILRQTARLLVLHGALRDVPAGLWDLECEWSGALTNGVVYGDRLTFRNQVRTYIAAPGLRADDRPLRVLTCDGEPLLLQLANGLLTPLADLPSLRERLRDAPAIDVDVVEVEVPLAPTVSSPPPLEVQHVSDDHFIVDAGEYGRLRVRTLAMKSDATALAEVEALLKGLPHYELV